MRKRLHHAESSATEKTQLMSSSSSSLDESSSSSSSLKEVQEDDSRPERTSTKKKSNKVPGSSLMITIPYTISLPLLVMIDMMGVSLVVPLLSSRYYQLAGVTSPVQREWLSSIYSATQIVGGLAIGTLADSQILSRHTILLLSFLGSAFAYSLIMQGGLTAIVISRITVGLVKQTMTVTSSILAHSTNEKERATHMGRLTASVTVAWIVGPSAGAYLFSHVGTYTPIYVSCSLFLLNSFIVLFCLPKEEEDDEKANDPKKMIKNKTKEEEEDKSKLEEEQQQQQSAVGRILHHFQSCFRSNNRGLASTVCALLLFQWVFKTTSYKNISTYYENRYGTEPHQRGYLDSYQAAIMFVVQSALIKPILQSLGGEVNATCVASLLMAIITFAELQVSFQQYLVVICPLMGIGIAILRVSLKSLLSKVAPKSSLSSVFATIDILQNIAMVTVPFYRTLLFQMTQPLTNQQVDVAVTTVDPDPKQWLIASGIHWMVATAVFSYLLWFVGVVQDHSATEKAATKEDDLVEQEQESAPSTNTKLKTS